MGPEFFQTQMGKKFYGADVPALIKVINRLADAIEKLNAIASNGEEVFASTADTDRCE